MSGITANTSESGRKGQTMKADYRELSPELLELAFSRAWSIESMAAHGAGDRGVEYIGSKIAGHTVTDYYKDTAGGWWYKNRALLNGEIVSMERYIFGREIDTMKGKRRKW